jgi:hypothetical protein
MNRSPLAKASSALVSILLFLQATILLASAYALAVIFRGARNAHPTDPLPGFVWWYLGAACIFLVAAFAYLLSPTRIRQWFIVLAVISLGYGSWVCLTSFPILLTWSGLLHGDFVALEAASGAVFCAIGAAGILDWKIRRL